MQTFYVYILTNKHNKVFYIGVTNNLMRRVYEHKNKLIPGFTKKYKVTKLVYFEEYGYIHDAIDHEKAIKGWLRIRKINLIKSINLTFKDLSKDWY